MLNWYNENPEKCWASKDVACYLVTSMVTRGKTEKHGVTQISQLVDLSQFARVHILPELAKPNRKCGLGRHQGGQLSPPRSKIFLLKTKQLATEVLSL